MTRIGQLKLRRWDVIAASPDKNLFFTMLFCSLGFIKALKCAIVTLVKPPTLVMGDPKRSKFSCDVVISFDRSLER